MFTEMKGDIFKSKCDWLCNPISCVGLETTEFDTKFPQMTERLREVRASKELDVGDLFFWSSLGVTSKNILCFTIRKHESFKSNLYFVESGLIKFVELYASNGVTSIAFPKLGCGDGKLDWELVRPIFVKYLEDLPIVIEVY